jgi:putative transposase
MFATDYQDSLKEKSYSSDLTWDQWEHIKPHLHISHTGRPIRIPLKDVVDAIFYITKNNCAWADLPHDFPDDRRVNEWFTKWRDDGTWQRLLDALREEARRAAGREPAPSEACLDSQSVKAAATGGERGYDGGKRVNGRKRHILVDTLGLLLVVVVTPASVSDSQGGQKVLAEVGPTTQPRLRTIHVDLAYERDGLRDYNADRGGYEFVFRGRPEGAKGFVPIKKRWVAERTFAWLGKYRRLARDYETSTESSEALIQVAMIQIMLKRKLTLSRGTVDAQTVGEAA